MNKVEAQRQKEIQQAEELLFAGPQALGFAKGLFLGHFVADWVMPYPRMPAAQQTELDKSLIELRQFLDAENRSPEKRLEAVFDWLIAWIRSKRFRGCAFVKAMAEYQDLDDPIHRAALAHKVALTAEIRRLAIAAGSQKPRNLSEQLSLLWEGAIVRSHAFGDVTPALRAREAAKILIRASRRSH